MTKRELIFAICVCLVLVTGIGATAYVSVVSYERDAVLNAQTEVEKSKIVEAEKTKRAIEHTKWLPWN